MLLSTLIEFTRPYRARVNLVFVLLLLQTMANLYVPSLNADIINNGVAKGDTGYIWQIGAVMLGVTAVQAVLSVWVAYLNAYISNAFGRDLRRGIFHKVLRFSTQEMDRFSNASLITRNTNDVQQVQMMVHVGLAILVSAPITMIGGLIMALRHNATLTLWIGAIVPVMALVVGVIMALTVPQFRLVQTRIDKINGVLREQITGLRVIRAFVRDDVERERFAEANTNLRNTQLKINRLMALAMPLLMLIMNLAMVGVVWFGGHLVADGKMNIGDISAFMAYMMQILMSVMMATMGFVMVPRAAASAERIQAVLRTEAAIVPPAATKAQTERGSVQLRDVSFRYPGAEEPVLNHINFEVKPGEFAAVVGGTGSGKTTLINLLLRAYDVSGGSVNINGVDVREQAAEQLWQTISLVPQRALLFSGTVRDNVRFGAQEIDDEAVWRALEISQAANFVRELEDGLDNQVTQGGTNLSGGQKQRLAIARAIATGPDILLLDDAFSALDAGTDARLRHALRKELSGTTLIVVAQRISTILNADRIIVLEDGTVAGIGSHDELLAGCQPYREIVSSQLELAQ